MSRLTCILLMLAGLVVCYFLLGLVPTLWLLGAFIVSYLLIMGLFLLPSFWQIAPIVLIGSGIVGAVLFLWKFGWQSLIAYVVLWFLFTLVQPMAGSGKFK